MEIKKAVRRALPIQLAIVGPTGSGKTVSALLLAAGLVGPTGKVVVIDTERGRASIHADNELVLSVLPNGFDVIDLDPPYHPKRFTEAMELAEGAGYNACIIDNGSDSWDGQGGCCDIAEAAKDKWIPAKLANKRMMMRAALSEMHIIWCLKAQDKTKVIDKTKTASGRQEYIDLGMQCIWEKNNLYPQLMVFSIDADTHFATVKKHTAEALRALFNGPRLLTRQDGEAIRRWNEGGKKLGPHDQLVARSRTAATEGTEAYKVFFTALTAPQKKALAAIHEENKRIAHDADAIPVFGSKDEPVEWPTEFDGPQLIWNGKLCRLDTDTGEYRESQPQAMAS